jgi:hypothetical protein
MNKKHPLIIGAVIIISFILCIVLITPVLGENKINIEIEPSDISNSSTQQRMRLREKTINTMNYMNTRISNISKNANEIKEQSEDAENSCNSPTTVATGNPNACATYCDPCSYIYSSGTGYCKCE